MGEHNEGGDMEKGPQRDDRLIHIWQHVCIATVFVLLHKKKGGGYGVGGGSWSGNVFMEVWGTWSQRKVLRIILHPKELGVEIPIPRGPTSHFLL